MSNDIESSGDAATVNEIETDRSALYPIPGEST